jgi:hypothetical protein
MFVIGDTVATTFNFPFCREAEGGPQPASGSTTNRKVIKQCLVFILVSGERDLDAPRAGKRDLNEGFTQPGRLNTRPQRFLPMHQASRDLLAFPFTIFMIRHQWMADVKRPYGSQKNCMMA